MRGWWISMVACSVVFTGCPARVEQGPEGASTEVGANKEAEGVYVVTDMAGPGDGGFNDVCLAGWRERRRSL